MPECPKCSAAFVQGAQFCPSCGTRVGPTTGHPTYSYRVPPPAPKPPPPPPTAPTAPKPRTTKLRLFAREYSKTPFGGRALLAALVFGALIVLLIVGGLIWSAIFGAPSHKSDEAWDSCRQFVTAKLKSPATAKFDSPATAQISSNGDVWTVRGVVDAQNSFGALVRTSYMCEMTNVGGNEFHAINVVLT